jgi:glycosyltransferase involved in cell wall biosynthesis
MISVLAVIVAPPHLSVSGAARAGERLSAALASRCRVTVASMMPETTHDPTVRHVPVHITLPAGLPWSRIGRQYRTPFYRSDIPDRIEAGGFDLVHLHNPMPALELRHIAAACRRAGIPYVISTHGFNEIAAGARVYGFGALQRLAWRTLIYRPVAQVVRNADAVLLLSAADAPIVHMMGFRGDVMPTVPNGTDPPVPAHPSLRSDILRRFNLADRDPTKLTCMFLANHTPNKGLPVLFRAFSSLDIPFLLIVGGERRSRIDYDGFARSLKSGQRVVVTGRLRDDEIAALMQRSDLFVFPTLADTQPLVVFEALGFGLPVVASHVGGIPYQVDDRCGVLVPPGDSMALASTIERLAADRNVLSAMGRAAATRAARFRTWEETATIVRAAYERVLSARRANRSDRRRKVPGAGSEPAVRTP